ncbi:DNA cytosine methyltransferase [Rhizobium leguminosarum]|uniref:DNA cytosine methyltransferase n=1 Tax=Rhizobium leguminosarum TaxID=384 RepID=UPI0009902831|nr:DNA (cytosine-5-)-methyltransferase [Rhizobium leguminosarum]MBB5261213.1 DNA (cytosine-5)-methyltransferase 1 [Rhizobium leguminosarum]MBY5378055.1 DNA cytosine methyltransferase [Rhizobium leguminosarum]MDX6000407.1 DNA (cytosine-5-)-methyltransferase [Rhizobium leguminosarum]OOO46058.1 DNA (cytosine-5-)-methyltransferase [Rhizobium leguminosarum bv. viciae USDA 2370]PUB60975.1 DNA (cytosine-5-)-methyltransferase [Rhizobium leguminosarum bv. viciae USDA 2370]
MKDLRSEALSKAKKAIRSLQQQMSDRLFKMAHEVEGLLEHLSPKDVVHFLHAGCEMDVAEAGTYVKVTKTLKSSEELLREARIQFPVLKALAASDDEARSEAISRIAGGATLGVRDVSAIRANLRNRKKTFAEQYATAGFQSSSKAARRRAVDNVRVVDKAATELLALLHAYRPKSITDEQRSDAHANIRASAAALLPNFISAYGTYDIPIADILRMPMHASERYLALANAAIDALAKGRFGGEFGLALDRSSLEAQWSTNFQECIQPITSTVAPDIFDIVTEEPAPLTSLPTQKLNVVELCAGAGGMSLGLEDAGYHPLALFEFDKHAVATLRLNRPLWNVVEGDIRQVDFTAYRSVGVDLLVGGPPCQGYSIDGKGLGKDDPRDLLLECARAVREMLPRAFVFENVVGLLNARHADHLGNFLKQLKKSGYAVQIVRMEAEDYGVAQERTRMLFVGLRQGAMSAFRAPPTFPHWRSNLGDVLGDLMAANGWTGAKDWAEARRNHLVVRNGIELRGALASTVVGRKGGSREKEAARWAKKGIDIATVADAAPTQEEADKCGAGFLPQLTLRMRARLQGFPDYWDFVGGKDSTARQVGNAVPPVIGQAIGLAVRSALTGKRFDYSVMLRERGCIEEPFGQRFIDAPPIAPDFRSTDVAELGVSASAEISA